MVQVGHEQFEQMVGRALDGLPAKLGEAMRNVAVTVEHGPGPAGLLGLYEGIPLTAARTSQYAGVLPDRITIYHQAICAICRDYAEVVEQVRRTVPRGRSPFRDRRRPPPRTRLVSLRPSPPDPMGDRRSSGPSEPR